jgi:putative ABC transport system permease protein
VVLERFHLAIALVTILAATVFLLALTIMLVDERRETVGTLRLIGLTRGRLLRQVLVEGVFIAAVGTLFGLLFALATEGAFNRFFQWRYDTALVFLRVTPGVIIQSVLLAVPLGIAASVIASWTLLRREPLELVRR